MLFDFAAVFHLEATPHWILSSACSRGRIDFTSSVARFVFLFVASQLKVGVQGTASTGCSLIANHNLHHLSM
jgi:hypothetical protein